MPVLRSVRNAIAKAVRRAVGFITDTLYGAGGHEPVTIIDFEEEFYRGVGVANFTDLVTHVRNGNAVMTDGYGPELVVNGTFDTDSDWTDESNSGASASIVDGLAILQGNNSRFTQNITTVVGKTYFVDATVTGAGSAMHINVFDDSNTSLLEIDYDAGDTGGAFTATSTTTEVMLYGYGSEITKFDNVSVREMPVLKWAPHNLLTYSEDFSNAAWSKTSVGVLADNSVAPNGTTTAEKVTANNATSSHYLSQTATTVAGQTTTIAVFAKAGEYDYIAVYGGNSSKGKYFDLSSGTILGNLVGAPADARISDVGNGWYLCEIDLQSNATSEQCSVYLSDTGSQFSFQGDGASGVYLWGFHAYRSDLGGMVDNPDRGDSYVPTAVRLTGPNLISNGTFDTDTTGWSAYNAVISVSSQQLVVDDTANAGSDSQAYQDITTEVGQAYELSFDKISTTSAFWFSIGSSPAYTGIYYSGSLGTTAGRQTHTFVAASTSTRIALITSSNGVTVYDNVVVRKTSVRPDTARYLPRIGHHVYNGSAWVNEGLLAESEARTNLVVQSHDFNTSWSKVNASVTSDDAVGPDGLESADLLVANTTNSQHRLDLIPTSSAGTQTFSVYLKPNGYSDAWLRIGTSGSGFNLTDGSTFTTTGGITTTAQEVGNGWYRCSVTTTSASANDTVRINVLNSSSANDFAGDGTSGIYIYGAMLEEAATPSSLIPTSGSSVTRAAETFTIPSANLPWPSPNYIGSELVTNGTFDSDITGWTFITGTASWNSGGYAQMTGTSTQTEYPKAKQSLGTLQAGSVYLLNVGSHIRVSGSGNLRAKITTSDVVGVGQPSGDFLYNVNADISNETYQFVAQSTAEHFIYLYRQDSLSESTFSIDNISVREINPLSVSIAMDGRVTYADEGTTQTSKFYRWRSLSGEYIQPSIFTDSTRTGLMAFEQTVSGVYDAVSSSATHYSPDVLVPFNVASRHGSTFLNGAVEGVALTENTTPTALADLESVDLNLAYDYMGTIRNFRIWDKDIGDAGLVEATQPSTEPSLSLTFEGTGTNSFVVNDWSE